jgi:hypothetical protein
MNAPQSVSVRIIYLTFGIGAVLAVVCLWRPRQQLLGFLRRRRRHR